MTCSPCCKRLLWWHCPPSLRLLAQPVKGSATSHKQQSEDSRSLNTLRVVASSCSCLQTISSAINCKHAFYNAKATSQPFCYHQHNERGSRLVQRKVRNSTSVFSSRNKAGKLQSLLRQVKDRTADSYCGPPCCCPATRLSERSNTTGQLSVVVPAYNLVVDSQSRQHKL